MSFKRSTTAIVATMAMLAGSAIGGAIGNGLTTVTRTTSVSPSPSSALASSTMTLSSDTASVTTITTVFTTTIGTTLATSVLKSSSSLLVASSITSSTTTATAAANTDPIDMTAINNTALGMTTNDCSLRSSMTWYWGANNDSVPYAKVAYSPRTDDQKILDVDSMSSMIDNAVCTNSSVQLHFTNSSGYDTAQNNWQWLEQGNANFTNRTLAMVVHYPTCGSARLPYTISNITYDNSTDTATLNGVYETDWSVACPGLNLNVNTKGVPGPVTAPIISKRDTMFTVPLVHDFSTTFFNKTVDGVVFGLNCAGCSTFGSLDFDIDVTFSIFSGFGGTASVTPTGLGASVGIGLSVSAGISSPLAETVALPNIVLPGGVNVIGVTVGPTIAIGVTASINTLDAEISVSVGAMANIADGAVASVDFTDSTKNVFTGLTPSFSPIGPTVQGSVNAMGSITPSIALGLDISAPGIGASAGIALLAPELDVTLTAQASSDAGFCGDATANAGVELDVDLVANFDVFAGLEPITALPNKIAILSTGTQLFSTCIPFTTAT